MSAVFPSAISPRRPVLRALRMAALCAAVGLSLLTFPGGVLWMIALWLTWHTLLVAYGAPGWLPLATCAAIVVAKGTFPSIGIVALLAGMLLVAALRAGGVRRARTARFTRIEILSLWLIWGAALVEDHYACHTSRHRTPPEKIAVVCLGDSLTAGGYPGMLTTSWQVAHDFGQDGITTGDALKKLPALEALRPDIVVVELGGHDFLKGRSRAQTAENLRTIVRRSREHGAEVILVEIPRSFVFDPWWGLERQLARELDLELIPDRVIRSFVLFSPYAPPGMWLRGPHFSDDGLHPNTLGHRHFALSVDAAIRRIYRDDLPHLDL